MFNLTNIKEKLLQHLGIKKEEHIAPDPWPSPFTDPLVVETFEVDGDTKADVMSSVSYGFGMACRIIIDGEVSYLKIEDDKRWGMVRVTTDGDPIKVAKALYNSKPVYIATYGNVAVTIKNIFGEDVVVHLNYEEE